MPISAGCSNPAASIFFLHLIAAAAAWLSTVYRFQAAADLQGRLQFFFSFILYCMLWRKIQEPTTANTICELERELQPAALPQYFFRVFSLSFFFFFLAFNLFQAKSDWDHQLICRCGQLV